MKKIAIIFFVGIILLSYACGKDKREVLFDMTYPDLPFEIPPGVSGSQALVFSYPAVESNINSFLAQHNVTIDEIGSIEPIRASIQSTDGRSLYFVQRAEIRVCSVDSSYCEPLFDQAFDASDLNGSATTRIDLIPGLQSQTDLLTSEYFKLEVIFYLNIGSVTPYDLKGRANVTFRALK